MEAAAPDPVIAHRAAPYAASSGYSGILPVFSQKLLCLCKHGRDVNALFFIISHICEYLYIHLGKIC